jgi:formylmethanofuran dehydrogenase subunit C
MSALSFTLKTELNQRVDCSPLIPDLLAGKSTAEIAALDLQSGNRKLRADAVFAIEGDDPNRIVFQQSTAKLDFIGKGMTSGSITVEGDAGSYLGMQMKNAVLHVSGNVDAYAACEMKSGELIIEGSAGDFLGAALPGNQKGLQGGIVIVKGNVADRCGDHMRRGVILIEGNTGGYLGSRMGAGTIAVLGEIGPCPGYAMKRGTLLLLKQPSLSATFNDCGTHTLGFLPLLLGSLRSYPSRFAELNLNRVRRYAGDLAGLGKGEILVAA